MGAGHPVASSSWKCLHDPIFASSKRDGGQGEPNLSLIRGRREVPVCFQMDKESDPRDHLGSSGVDQGRQAEGQGSSGLGSL